MLSADFLNLGAEIDMINESERLLEKKVGVYLDSLNDKNQATKQLS